jgi:predicted phosphodiesterase
MRIAILSDIHGNMDAFQAVLKDIEDRSIRSLVSLGDNIGYGPDSEEVVSEIRRRDIPSVMGNHELAVADPGLRKWFNPTARISLEKNIERMSDETLAYAAELPYFLVRDNARFVHGFPPESPLLYHFQVATSKKRRVIRNMAEDICFIGHTHDLGLICLEGRQIEEYPLEEGHRSLEKWSSPIVNAGSVGQPRDGNRHAKYVIWDRANRSIEVRFVPYDATAVAKRIIDLGLPRSHAEILLGRSD